SPARLAKTRTSCDTCAMRPNGMAARGVWPLLLTLFIDGLALAAADVPSLPEALTIHSDDSAIRLQWHPPSNGLALPTEFRLQWTTDLRHWENTGEKVRRTAGSTTGWTAEDISGGSHAFYRLIVRPGIGFTSSDPAEVLGVGGAFLDE